MTLPGIVSGVAENGAGGCGRDAGGDRSRDTERVSRAFKFDDPSVGRARHLRARSGGDARGAGAARHRSQTSEFVLALKEQQMADAIHAALGISLTAVAQPCRHT